MTKRKSGSKPLLSKENRHDRCAKVSWGSSGWGELQDNNKSRSLSNSTKKNSAGLHWVCSSLIWQQHWSSKSQEPNELDFNWIQREVAGFTRFPYRLVNKAIFCRPGAIQNPGAAETWICFASPAPRNLTFFFFFLAVSVAPNLIALLPQEHFLDTNWK